MEFCQRLLLHLFSGLCGFVLVSEYMLYYVYEFTYIEPSLHPWNETELAMVYDLLTCC
jgi:hypothetical protein